MLVVTQEQFEKTVLLLQKQIEELQKNLTPLLAIKMADDEVLDRKQASKMTKLSERGLSEARRRGRIKAVKVNEKGYGYKVAEIKKYLQRYKHELLS